MNPNAPEFVPTFTTSQFVAASSTQVSASNTNKFVAAQANEGQTQNGEHRASRGRGRGRGQYRGRGRGRRENQTQGEAHVTEPNLQALNLNTSTTSHQSLTQVHETETVRAPRPHQRPRQRREPMPKNSQSQQPSDANPTTANTSRDPIPTPPHGHDNQQPRDYRPRGRGRGQRGHRQDSSRPQPNHTLTDTPAATTSTDPVNPPTPSSPSHTTPHNRHKHSKDFDKSRPYWWQRIPGDDPITMEPINRLKLSPFQLNADEKVVYFFDAQVLGHYLVSSANFVHPISRRALTREECTLLDQHLREHHRIPNPNVTEIFDHKDDIVQSNDVFNVREESSRLLQALFHSQFGHVRSINLDDDDDDNDNVPPPPPPPPSISHRPARRGERGWTVVVEGSDGNNAASRQSAAQHWPALTSHTSTPATTSSYHPTSYPLRNNNDLSRADFPPLAATFASQLIQNSDPEPPPVVPPRNRFTPLGGALGAGGVSSSDREIKVLSLEVGASSSDNRSRMLADAFGVADEGHTSQLLGATTSVWSRSARSFARSHPRFVSSLESALSSFCRDPNRAELKFEKLTTNFRAVVHEVSGNHNLDCQTSDVIVVSKRKGERANVPLVLLSQASSDESSYFEGLTNNSPSMVLTEVSSTVDINSLLRHYRGLFRAVWATNSTAVVVFQTQNALNDARAELGGGIKGKFRVTSPWAEAHAPPKKPSKPKPSNAAKEVDPEEFLPPPSDVWPCERCTFHNPLSAKKCDVCGIARPKSRVNSGVSSSSSALPHPAHTAPVQVKNSWDVLRDERT